MIIFLHATALRARLLLWHRALRLLVGRDGLGVRVLSEEAATTAQEVLRLPVADKSVTVNCFQVERMNRTGSDMPIGWELG